MAYNFFPNGYQPQQMYYPQQQMNMQQRNGRIYVQGPEGGKSYLVAPNTTVDLWDVEQPLIYVKSADANGVPTMRVFKYEEVTNAPAPAQTKPAADYTPISDFEKLKSDVEEIKEYLKSQTRSEKEKEKTK